MLAYIPHMESAFGIIAEPNRRAILSMLLSSERSVGEIESELRLSQPSVSKHLRVLRDAGFVESRIEAQRRLYRLRAEPLMELEEWLVPFRRLWSKHVDALERHLDRIDRIDRIDRMDERISQSKDRHIDQRKDQREIQRKDQRRNQPPSTKKSPRKNK